MTQPLLEPARRRRPGGRSERNRHAVATAVLELLRDGRSDLSVAEAALKAGVHRSTIYRRWPTVAELIREALTVHTASLAITDTGRWESDLHAIASALADFFADPAEVAMNASLAAQTDPAVVHVLIDHWLPIIASIRDVVTRAIERGEVAADVDPTIVVELLVSPLLVQTTFLRARATPEHVTRLVRAVLRLTT